MNIDTKNIVDYLELIPEERKVVLKKIIEVVEKNIPKGFELIINYGMPSYVVPKTIYPNGYHCNPQNPLPFVSIASQKKYVSIYHMGLYASKELMTWFLDNYNRYSKEKLDMGKSCIRFKKMDQIPYELLGELMQKMTVNEWITIYERQIRH